MMSSNFRYFLYKHRVQIIIGIASLLVLIAIFAVVLILFKDDGDINDFEAKVDYANYYLVGEKNGVSVYDTSGEKCGSVSYVQAVYPNNLSNTMIVFANNQFMELSVYEKTTGCGIKETPILKYERKNVAEFFWNEEYLAIKRDTGSFEVYNRENKESIYLTDIDKVDEFIVVGDNFVYSVDNSIVSVDLNSEESVVIDVGAGTYGFATYGDKVVAYNKFGNGNNTTTIFILNPSDLYIEDLLVENTANVYPVSGGSACFIRKANNIVFAQLSGDNKLNSTTLNLKVGEKAFASNNTLFYEDYLYSTKDGYMAIISIKNKLVQHTINICGEYFSPVYIKK